MLLVCYHRSIQMYEGSLHVIDTQLSISKYISLTFHLEMWVITRPKIYKNIFFSEPHEELMDVKLIIT